MRISDWSSDVCSSDLFPFYIIHQTVIVVVGYAIVGRGIAPGAEFAILLAATVAGCWGFYLIGREIGWLRPLIGLRVAKARTSATPRGDGRLDPADPRWRRDRSEEHTAELQSLMRISYAVFRL